jgi:hypothetical protein
MKYSILLLIILNLVAGCQNTEEKKTTTDESTDESTMKGAYSMKKQVGNDGTKDTLLKKEQLKIYTDHHMMYASPHATDSFGEYGIATYRRDGDTVKENIFYTSTEGEIRDTATLAISNLQNGYKQVIKYVDSNGTFTITEDYDRVGDTQSTPLDGAWRQVKYMTLNKKGDTVTNSKRTQFKMYQNGHFIWANPIKDPASNNFKSTYGYGTFKMKNDSTTEETNINSTYQSTLVGIPVTIKIQFAGKDDYKQTIESSDGNKSVEVYQRLK